MHPSAGCSKSRTCSDAVASLQVLPSNYAPLVPAHDKQLLTATFGKPCHCDELSRRMWLWTGSNPLLRPLQPTRWLSPLSVCSCADVLIGAQEARRAALGAADRPVFGLRLP